MSIQKTYQIWRLLDGGFYPVPMRNGKILKSTSKQIAEDLLVKKYSKSKLAVIHYMNEWYPEFMLTPTIPEGVDRQYSLLTL
jgi:hypothetical protein